MLWTAGAIVALVAIWFGVVFLIPGDVVASRYATLAEARADHLFERGWLPDILPASAHDIRTTNNLDLSLSDGEFSFKPVDAAAFVSRVQPYRAAPNQLKNIEALVAKMRRKGFEPYSFIDEDTTWVFFCKAEAGHCEYTMWVHRDVLQRNAERGH